MKVKIKVSHLEEFIEGDLLDASRINGINITDDDGNHWYLNEHEFELILDDALKSTTTEKYELAYLTSIGLNVDDIIKLKEAGII